MVKKNENTGNKHLEGDSNNDGVVSTAVQANFGNVAQGSFFVDLDGTLFNFGTNDFTPGSQQFLTWIKDNNHQLIIVTRRGDYEFEGHPIFSKTKTIEALKRLGIQYHKILFDIVSPRTIINDDECYGLQVLKNGGLSELLDILEYKG